MISAQEALERLREGNRRYVAGFPRFLIAAYIVNPPSLFVKSSPFSV